MFIHLAMTAFSRTIDEKYLERFGHFIAKQNKTNACVFIDHWINHKADHAIFDHYIEEVESHLQIKSLMNDLPIEKYQDAEIFPAVNQEIIIYITNSLLERQEDYDNYLALIELRRSKCFYATYRNVYEALFYTVKTFTFKKEFDYGIPQGTASDVYEAYKDKYYVMDTYYRKFYVAYDAEGGHDLLAKLKNEVEFLYKNWFMGDLGTIWAQCVQADMATDWALPNVFNLQQFYHNEIALHMDKNERAFVIISDALFTI